MTQKIKDQYEKAYNRDYYTCQRCGRPANQQAHRIANTKINNAKYGSDIINNVNNLVSVCGLYCNALYNIGYNDYKTKNLINFIKENINKVIDIDTIEKIIE